MRDPFAAVPGCSQPCAPQGQFRASAPRARTRQEVRHQSVCTQARLEFQARAGARTTYFAIDSGLTHKDLPGVGFTLGEVPRFCLAGGGFSTEHDTAVSV
jgi:hypothetical protein